MARQLYGLPVQPGLLHLELQAQATLYRLRHVADHALHAHILRFQCSRQCMGLHPRRTPAGSTARQSRGQQQADPACLPCGMPPHPKRDGCQQQRGYDVDGQRP